MCDIDYLVFGMYGLFGALGSYIIYQRTKPKIDKHYRMGVVNEETIDPNKRVD